MSPRTLLPLWAAIFSSVLASPLAMAADAPTTTAPAAAAATPSAKVELFNGKDLTGWTSFLKGGTPAA